MIKIPSSKSPTKRRAWWRIFLVVALGSATVLGVAVLMGRLTPPNTMATLFAPPTARVNPSVIMHTDTPSSQLAATSLPRATLPFGSEGEPALQAPTPTPSVYTIFLPHVDLQLPPTLTSTPMPPPAQFVVPAPAPNWPNALPGLTASKISLHTLGDGDPYIMEFVRRAHPRLIKAVDNIGWLAEVKAASSATVTIGRLNTDQDESWAAVREPAEAARTYIAAQLERYQKYPMVDYWEGWNEFDPNDDAKLTWYGQFEAERVCQMQALGLRGAVGGFAYGVPEYYEMELFYPALEAAHRCGGIFTLHEGVSSRIGCGIGVNDPNVLIPGSPMFPDVTLGYHMLRYRFWYEGYLKPRGIGNLPLVISELGVAPDATCGPGGAAWKDYREWWVQNGVGPNGPQAYVNLLAWYDSELRKDSYVIGTTIFTAAAMGNSHWDATDVHDVIIPLAYYAVSQVSSDQMVVNLNVPLPVTTPITSASYPGPTLPTSPPIAYP